MTLEGTYYKTIYKNLKSGIANFYIIPNKDSNIKTDNGLLRCKGKIGLLTKNIPIKLEGEFEKDEFLVTDYEIPSHTKDNLFKLLAFIDDSITPAQKESISELTNNDLISYIKNNDKNDELIKGLLPKSSKIEELKESNSKKYEKAYEIATRIRDKISNLIHQEELVSQLLVYGVEIGKIEVLCNKGITIDQIKENPYMGLLKFGIPITVSEMYAYQNSDMDDYDIRRLCGFVYDAMICTKSYGDTCAEFTYLLRLINHRMKLFKASSANPIVFSKSMLALCLMEMKKYLKCCFIDNKVYIYFNDIWEEEISIIKDIERIQNGKKELEEHLSIDEIEVMLNIKYNEEQRNAFNALKTSGIKILTGLPGSGKTAVIRGMIKYFQGNGKVKLCATTASAAKVMADACGMESETVNKMLELRFFNETTTGKNLNDPVDADLIVVDEVSMAGLKLFSALLRAVKSGSILLLVGDEDQLQSVDYGNVLHDLIESEAIEVYRLTKVLRQSGTICQNAQKINNKETDITLDDTFEVKKFEDNESAVKALLRDINDNEDYKLLTPTKIYNKFGTSYLNKLLQNKSSEILVSYGDNDFRMNDIVVMTNNNYECNYINGDTGKIIGTNDDCLVIQFEDKTLTISKENIVDVDLAYAITIHRSQGDEFGYAYILLQDAVKNMMTKRLFYTAVTRAKKKIIVYDVNDSMRVSIENSNERERVTKLGVVLRKDLDTNV